MQKFGIIVSKGGACLIIESHNENTALAHFQKNYAHWAKLGHLIRF